MCIIHTPNLGLGVTIPGWEKEQSRFRGSIEGAKRRSKRAAREHEGVQVSSEGARGAQREHTAELGLSAGAMRRYRILKLKDTIYIYIYIF